MSERLGASERTIVEILRAGAENAAAPLAARERVRAKLSARAGMLGLVASATVTAGSAGAAAGSAAATTGTVAVSAPSVVGLLKLLVVGMVLGASTGLGLRFVGQRPVAVAATGVVRGASPLSVLAEPAPRPAAVPNAVAATTVPRANAPLRAPEPPLVPTPELPAAPAPVPDETLAAQQALLDDARVALRRGDGEQALRALEAHRARFPRTAFEEERRVVEIRASLLLGNRVAARERARAFVESYPKSMLLPSLKGELQKAGLSDSETDSTLTPQYVGGGKETP
jgi:hypothetical protein